MLTHTITVQGERVCVHNTWAAPARTPPEQPVRGDVTHFTAKSRKRLSDQFASLKPEAKRLSIFVTLTYGQRWPDCAEAKRHLNVFLQHIRRNYPGASAVWRLEYQVRGAPHFHFIFFGLPFWDKEVLARTWAGIVGAQYCDWTEDPPCPPFTRIEKIRDARKAWSYLYKYLAKSNHPIKEKKPGFNNVPYSNENQGRWWGIHNRKAMPWAQKQVLKAAYGDGNMLDCLKILAAEYWDGIILGSMPGFTLYTEDAEKFWELAEYLIAHPKT